MRHDADGRIVDQCMNRNGPNSILIVSVYQWPILHGNEYSCMNTLTLSRSFVDETQQSWFCWSFQSYMAITIYWPIVVIKSPYYMFSANMTGLLTNTHHILLWIGMQVNPQGQPWLVSVIVLVVSGIDRSDNSRCRDQLLFEVMILWFLHFVDFCSRNRTGCSRITSKTWTAYRIPSISQWMTWPNRSEYIMSINRNLRHLCPWNDFIPIMADYQWHHDVNYSQMKGKERRSVRISPLRRHSWLTSKLTWRAFKREMSDRWSNDFTE
jgi:hypothetical protein